MSVGAGNASNPQGNKDLLAVDYVVDWLRADPPEPFAVWIAGDGSHPPYGAPAPYQHMYDPAAVAAAAPLRPTLPDAAKPLHIGASQHRTATRR